MVATEITKHDGQYYGIGENIPDLGTIKCVGLDGNKRIYEGDIADESKLDLITYAPDGSEALLYDGSNTKVKHSLGGVWKAL